jgi:hypothetical protein
MKKDKQVWLGPVGEPYTIEQWRAWTGRCGAMLRNSSYGASYCMRVAVRKGRCRRHDINE